MSGIGDLKKRPPRSLFCCFVEIPTVRTALGNYNGDMTKVDFIRKQMSKEHPLLFEAYVQRAKNGIRQVAWPN